MVSKGSKGKKSTHRKLTAILCADVVGYSRLMGADEEATIETLTAYRKIFLSDIKKLRGRVVDAKGDAILAEFASVVDAVNSAVKIQRELGEKNTELPDDRRMDFRIGINLGDVVVKDDVIYGDGVNVAARLESLAEPGGICISRPVFDQVESKLKLDCEYLGEQQVKNIAEPVRAYKVLPPAEAGEVDAARAKNSGVEGPDAGRRTLKSSGRPSIGVLPFANISGDPDQEYFSDGITEDLITALSRISRLSVVSRNSVFFYKGRALNARQIGQELGVSYIVEGSVRKSGNRVRITAQLIDTATDRHLWSERYDRALEDVFALQDEITHNIVSELNVALLDGPQAARWRGSTQNPDAYYLFLRGRHLMQTNPSRENYQATKSMWEQCVELDPGFARVYSALAALASWGASLTCVEVPRPDEALGLAQKALSLDPSDSHAHGCTGVAHLLKREFDEALAAVARAVELDPDGPLALRSFANVHMFCGDPNLARDTIRKMVEIIPSPTALHMYVSGLLHFMVREYDDAVAVLQDVVSHAANFAAARLVLAAAYGALGRAAASEAEAKEVLRITPGFSLQAQLPRTYPFKDPAHLERLTELLRKAGLPE